MHALVVYGLGTFTYQTAPDEMHLAENHLEWIRFHIPDGALGPGITVASSA